MSYKIFSFVSDFTSCGYYRSVLPALHLQAHLAKNDICMLASNLVDEANIDYDTFVFGRVPDPTTFMFALKMYEAGKTIVWDLDDDFLTIPDWSPVKDLFGAVAIGYLTQALKMATYITVSTVPLADAVAAGWPALGNKIKVLENLVDTRTFFQAHSSGPGALTKILWSGSHTHGKDLDALDPVVDLVNSNSGYIMTFYGHIPDRFKNKKNVIYVSWGPKRNYEGTLSLLAPDIALLPLLDCPFNRCKSAIKFFEMTLAGAMCIASDIPPFSDVIDHEVNGILFPIEGSTLKEGVEYWCRNRDDMEMMNKNARQHVIESYSWNSDSVRRRAWQDFYVSLA